MGMFFHAQITSIFGGLETGYHSSWKTCALDGRKDSGLKQKGKELNTRYPFLESMQVYT